MRKTKLWIAGKWVTASRNVTLYNPHTGGALAEIGHASPKQASLAIEAAAQAFLSFSDMPIHERAMILHKAALIIELRQEEAALIIVEEAAKPITAARKEIKRTIQTYHLSAEAAKYLHGEVIPMDAVPHGENHIAYVTRKPLGVVTAITPFNFPFNLVAHKVGPAIAAGNTIVLKPAEKTPLSSLFLAEVFQEAGLPPGVLNIIPGDGKKLSEVLTQHDKVPYITFTGSPKVGSIIRKQAGLRRVALELGSNSPLLVDQGFNTTELDRIAGETVKGAFAYNGQICISIQRAYVHSSIYDEFIKLLVKHVDSLKIGDPLNEDTDISALINSEAAHRLQGWLDNAVKRGAQIHAGGRFDKSIMHPTVLTHVPADTELNCEEAFGPVVTVAPFELWEDAIQMANASKYGINVGVFTKDIERSHKAAKLLQAGGVLINEIPTFRVDHMPYGGVKDSGIGREGVRYAMEEMMELKLVGFRTGVYVSE